MKVLILGAGPSGLAAAWKLASANVEVEIVELENQVGGLCRTIKHGEYSFDLGGHRFITQNISLADEIKKLMGDELLDRPRTSTIRLQGKYFHYPLESIDLLKKMRITTSIKCFLDYCFTGVKNKIFHKEDLSLEDWVVNRFGRSLYNIYFGPYSAKLWGMPPTQISSDWAAQRISLLNLWDVFLRLLGKKKNMPKTYATKFYYPKMGIGRIPERMCEEACKNGATLHLNTKVKEIVFEENKAKGVVLIENGTTKYFSADYIISSIPLPDMVKMIRPEVSTEYIEVVNSMKYRGIRFMNLCINKEKISDNTWIYIPEEEFLFFRIQETKNWSPYHVPSGKTALILEIACNEGDATWNNTEYLTYKRCVEDLKKLGFDVEYQVKDYFSTRIKHAYPIYDLNYREKLSKIYSLLAKLDNFIPCGRQALYRYNNMDHSIEMGIVASNHILKGLPKYEIFKIASEAVPFETDEKQA
ncbi:MAG: FAD-dependent oxidoreductase [bacterium]